MNTADNLNIDISNNLEEFLLYSYMNFINNSNNSLHNMISIINEQQSSFNHLLSHYDMLSSSRTVRRPSRYLSSYNNSHNYYAVPSNINRPYFNTSSYNTSSYNTSSYNTNSNRPNTRSNIDTR